MIAIILTIVAVIRCVPANCNSTGMRHLSWIWWTTDSWTFWCTHGTHNIGTSCVTAALLPYLICYLEQLLINLLSRYCFSILI